MRNRTRGVVCQWNMTDIPSVNAISQYNSSGILLRVDVDVSDSIRKQLWLTTHPPMSTTLTTTREMLSVSVVIMLQTRGVQRHDLLSG